MTLKIAVCDDVAADRQRLMYLIKSEYTYCKCSAYESGELLLWDFESGNHFDIILLDIFMEGISGMETAKRIRTVDPNVILIFVSSSDDFYREAYDLYAFNYLIKPLEANKLSEVLQRATNKLEKDTENVIHFSFNNSFYTVRYSQLLYLASEMHVVKFHLTSGETLKSYGKIDDFVTKLPEEVFVRCHQSYIINLKHVTGMTTDEFMLGNVKVPISRKYSAQAREKYRAEMFADF